jgi:hypothetical protein
MKCLMTSCTRKTSNVTSYIRFTVLICLYRFHCSEENYTRKMTSRTRKTSNVAVWKSTVKWNVLWRDVRRKQVTLQVIFALQSFNIFILVLRMPGFSPHFFLTIVVVQVPWLSVRSRDPFRVPLGVGPFHQKWRHHP